MTICEEHAAKTDLIFSTDKENPEKSKTMCIAFPSKGNKSLGKISLNGDYLPWKDRVNHLGFILTSDCSSAQDVLKKRASFISTVYSLNQEFLFASPEVRLQMLRLYNTTFFGSNCWEFSSKQVSSFSKSWNVNLRILFDLPREAHSWVVEALSGGRHFLQMIYSRFVKYLKVLRNNKKPGIRSLYNTVASDAKTLTGANVRKVLLDTGRDPRCMAKHELRDWTVYQPADTWTVPLLVSLLELRQENWEVNFDIEEEMDSLEDKEVNFMIEAVCSG